MPYTSLATDVFVSDGLAYVAGREFVVIDVNNPSSPTLRGVCGLPSPGTGVFVSGNLAVVAGCGLVDITNPSVPTPLRWVFPSPFDGDRVFVAGNFAYFGGQPVDVIDPTFVQPTATTYGSRPSGVFVSGDWVYVAAGASGLQIYDSALPVRRGHYCPLRDARGIAISDGKAYVACGDAGGLRIINTTNPAAPTPVGVAFTSGETRDVAVSNNIAYVADGEGSLPGGLERPELRIIDVANPAAPIHRSVFFGYSGNYAYDVAVSGAFAYLACVWYPSTAVGLEVINVSNPDRPIPHHWDSLLGPKALFVSDNMAYLACGNRGLWLVDVSDPGSPTFRSYSPLQADDVFVSGDLAYVVNSGWFNIFDVSDPTTTPTLRSCFHVPSPGTPSSTHVSGGLAYVACGTGGLRVLDVSNSAAPVARGTYDTPGEANGVFASGQLAYVTDKTTVSLWILRYTGPNVPPVGPWGLTAATQSTTQINLRWKDPSDEEEGFRIERKTSLTGAWSPLTAVGAGVTTFADSGLVPNTLYFYRVRAYTSVDNSPYSNETSAITTLVLPAAPSALTAAFVSANRVDLSWTDNADNEAGFKIERKREVTGT